MSAESPRFDVHYRSEVPSLDYHFCREWDGETGCYGTNPDHGYTFFEAREQIADWHEREAARWRKMTFAEWSREPQNPLDAGVQQ